MLRVQTALSVFVYGPFYLVLLVALVKRTDFIRVPALVFAGALGSNVVIYTVAALALYRVAEPLLFVTVNLPYLGLAVALVRRYGRPVAAARASGAG